MYKKSKTVKVPTCHSRKVKFKILLIAICFVLAAVISSVTIAFIIDKTNPADNTFIPSKVDCRVQEDFDNRTTKKDVYVENIGDVESYIRVAIVATWMMTDDTGTMVTADKPIEGTDYDIIYNNDTLWQKSADGYWYYTKPVKAGESTEIFIESCSQLIEAPEGFSLSVEILASAIQSTPTTAVLDNWDDGVNNVAEDGSLVINREV